MRSDTRKQETHHLGNSFTEDKARHRFLLCVNHNVFDSVTEKDYIHIARGNRHAHDGSSREVLYQGAGGRKDYVFSKDCLSPGVLYDYTTTTITTAIMVIKE